MNASEVEILLVDDSPADVELTIHELRRQQLANRICVAEDGEAALDFLFCRGKYSGRSSDHPPKLILLDLKLPKRNGLEVLQTVKSDPRTRAIPVVVLTSSKQHIDLINSYRLGVNSYVQKPVDFGQFENAIRQLGLYWLVVNAPPPDELFEERL